MTTTVVVTGASGGLGRAVVAELLAQGYQVLALDRNPIFDGEDGVLSVGVDLADFPAVTRALKRRSTPVGAIIHCAAEQPLGEVGNGVSVDSWTRAFLVNVLALEHIVSELRRDLAATAPRRIISIGSIHESTTSVNLAPYSISKAALRAWVRAAAIDLGPSGVCTVGISAGAINSPKLDEGLARFPNPDQAREHLVSQLPVGRVVEPRDLAVLCLFLLREEAMHFNGSSLTFDGGASSLLATE